MRISKDYEIKSLNKQNHELMEANIKLADELKWANEDKQRLQNRIARALAYIEAEKIVNDSKVLNAITKYGNVMKDILENDFYEW